LLIFANVQLFFIKKKLEKLLTR